MTDEPMQPLETKNADAPSASTRAAEVATAQNSAAQDAAMKVAPTEIVQNAASHENATRANAQDATRNARDAAETVASTRDGALKENTPVKKIVAAQTGGGSEAASTRAMPPRRAASPNDFAAAASQNAPSQNADASTRDAAKAPSAKAPSAEVEALRREERVASLVMQARSVLRRGKRDEARALLQQTFALSPTDGGALELLGDIFLEEGEQEKAIAIFERGRGYHPRHAAFEEKIALARIDQQEEEIDKIRREMALQQGDTETWQDKKPSLAALLSLMLPGAGHVYLERYEKAAAYFVAWLVTFCGWYFTLRAALPTEAASAALRQSRNFLAPFATAFSSLSGFSRLWFWTMMLLHLGLYIASAIDAAQSAKTAAEARRRELGL